MAEKDKNYKAIKVLKIMGIVIGIICPRLFTAQP